MTSLDGARLAGIRSRVMAELAELPERIGRYAVRGELGRGGMGIVYDAFDPALERPVAVKAIDATRLGGAPSGDAAARFEQEMRATSALFHPNLVAILDAGVERAVEPPLAYYVMERVDGPSLEERLQARGPLPRAEALAIGAAIARGLHAAHAQGLVHRDLKPANVLLPLAGPPKVADFGLCHARRESAPGDPPVLLGSPHYLAPEQVRCGPVDARADLFALGIVLLRMLSGNEPFPAPTLQAHLYRVLHDEPEGLTTLDADVRRLVERLVAKSVDARPVSAAAVADELERLAATPEPGASAPDPPLPRRRGGPTAPRAAAAFGLLLVVLLAAGAIAARNHLVALEHEVETRWRQVENQLARQHELIPRLYAVAERHVAVEDESLRRTAALLGDFAGVAGPDRADRALALLLVLGQRLPSLGTDDRFRALAHEIAGTKNRIAVERARYNEAVGRYNARLEQLPFRLVAGDRLPRRFFEPPTSHLVEPPFGA